MEGFRPQAACVHERRPTRLRILERGNHSFNSRARRRRLAPQQLDPRLTQRQPLLVRAGRSPAYLCIGLFEGAFSRH
jgi:hypothetical protein